MKAAIIISGVLFLFAWLIIYFKYFSEGNEKAFLLSKVKKSKIDNKTDSKTDSRTYFVAPWGEDNNTGSATSPWKTLQCSVDRLDPGDRLLIRGGVYKEFLTLKKSGTSENPIVVSAFQGEEALLDGNEVGWKYGLNIEFGVSFLHLSGLRINYFEGYGIAMWGENRSVQLKDVEVTGCGTGARIISATDLLIESCDFHNNNGTGLVVSPGPLNGARILSTRFAYNDGPELPEGFTLESGTDIVMEKCTAEFNTGNGFSYSACSAAIDSCMVRDNGSYGILCNGNNLSLINCIFDNNGMAGVALQGGGIYWLYNDLIVNCGIKGDYGLLAIPRAGSTSARVALVNNIFAFNYGGVYLGSFAMLEDEAHNIYWSREDAEISSVDHKYSRQEINERVWFMDTGLGEHSFCRNPLFVDLDGRDYRLAKNSPAIDRGTPEGSPSTDFNGGIRPRGGGYDIGPYEAAEGILVPPTATITYAPCFSSDESCSIKFNVKWAGHAIEREVAGFNVQFKDGAGGTWQNWLAETEANESVFEGTSGHTYYFRVRSKDNLDNWGNWSESRFTMVPLDDCNPLIKYNGDWVLSNAEASFLNTVHYSASPGAAASLRFTAEEAAWISSCGPDRGHAMVYIDDILQTMVDLYSEEYLPCRPVLTVSLDGKPHNIRIQVAETKNEQSSSYRVDIDGFAVKQ